MAQTQSQQFASQAFSPPGSTPSPSPGAPSPVSGIAPPPKRQRLSPLPQSHSPYASPSFGTLQLPRTGSPVNGNFANGTPTPTMNAPPPPGSMGPPSRPVEKATDTAELTDVLASSGIDVREEEEYLTHAYGQAPLKTQQPPRIQTNFNNSFASQPSAGTASAGPSFSESTLQKSTPTQGAFATSTPSTAEPATAATPEVAAEDEKLRQATAASRRMQYPLQAPFLFTAMVEDRIQKRAYDLGVRMPAQGVYRPFPGRAAGPVEITGPDGSSVIRTGKTLLTQDAPLGDILSLISLACEERLRSVVDHSYGLAKNRRANSHGSVPLEWSDMAVTLTAPGGAMADGASNMEASTNTPTPKRPFSDDNAKGTDLSNKNPVTIANIIAKRSRSFIEKDISNEERRARKRARRSANAILGGNSSRAGSVGAGTPGAATPTAPASERASDDRKTTKKDSKKADSKVTEAVQHQQSVETARMATNNLTSGLRFGGKKKTYSWLTSGSPVASRSGFSTPPRPNISTTVSGTTTVKSNGGTAGGPSKSVGKQMGDWREDDKERGAGIQIRDILFMLEVDGKGSKHLQKAYSKGSKEDVDKPVR
ncbi:hypothetical protein AJ78_00429 [Emergomyces pasteurianus Ep9510]|uniref:Transcription initiation factor TFIID subunit 4 n=1 Tax=Emergomyces pasteurianus Ep9510 TaxID=1447872 RepID=A0A1J9QUM3_9EURO|nr:hypothetical protein AJ78_00429 [Emergomyces pasteurianus Ep9510]